MCYHYHSKPCCCTFFTGKHKTVCSKSTSTFSSLILKLSHTESLGGEGEKKWLQHSATLSHTKISTKSISRLKYTSDFCHEVNAYGVRDAIYFEIINTSLLDEQSIIFSLLDQRFVARLFLLDLARRDSLHRYHE